jgi:hypothetical protein
MIMGREKKENEKEEEKAMLETDSGRVWAFV